MFPFIDFVTQNMKMAMEGLDWLQLKKNNYVTCALHTIPMTKCKLTGLP
jgi:hypothetical protein